MKIRFLQDYRGWLTDEQFYARGDEVDDLPLAEQLIAAGRAELVEPPVFADQPKEEKSKK